MLDDTQHSQQTNIHAPCAIRTRNPSKRAAADPRHWDRPFKRLAVINSPQPGGSYCVSGYSSVISDILVFQRVGCDLKIGSMKKVDGCGVCGGDGQSCAQPLYHWEEAAMSLCSVTCGGGWYHTPMQDTFECVGHVPRFVPLCFTSLPICVSFHSEEHFLVYESRLTVSPS